MICDFKSQTRVIADLDLQDAWWPVRRRGGGRVRLANSGGFDGGDRALRGVIAGVQAWLEPDRAGHSSLVLDETDLERCDSTSGLR